MRSTTRKLLAISLTGALALAACGDDDDTSVAQSGAERTEQSETAEEPTGAAADEQAMSDGEMTSSTDSPAAVLRADLTSLLQEHVYLAGIAIETALDASGDLEAPAVQAAVATLDANSVALSEAIGAVAGQDQADAFLELWRQHIGFFVDYTLGRATDDQAAVDTALTELDGYQQAAGAFFEEITAGELPADAVVESLDTHVATLTAAIDALVAGDAGAFSALQAAADHMDSAALAISTAIAAALPDEFPGEVTGGPAETRATLTSLLQEHAYLAGIAIEQAVEAGGDLETPAVQAAVATLDANSVELADVVGSVSDDEQRAAFLDLWRQHIGFFVDYTLGQATDDQAAVDTALTELDGYQQAAGAFFEQITAGELPADALVENLDMHVETLTAAIDALVAGDAAAFDLLRDAGQHMPSAAAALSAAIVAATA